MQLLAEQAVYRVNLSGLRACTPQVLDEAIASAIVSGDNVLYRLVYSESRLAGELDYLNRFRIQDVQEPPTDEAVYQSLRRRLMVVEERGRWRMRVPRSCNGGCGGVRNPRPATAGVEHWVWDDSQGRLVKHD